MRCTSTTVRVYGRRFRMSFRMSGQWQTCLDMKTHVSNGEADLTIFVLTRSGELVGTYRGESTFKENFNPTGEVAPGARLNRALSEAVQQIQQKILRDAHLRTLALR